MKVELTQSEYENLVEYKRIFEALEKESKVIRYKSAYKDLGDIVSKKEIIDEILDKVGDPLDLKVRNVILEQENKNLELDLFKKESKIKDLEKKLELKIDQYNSSSKEIDKLYSVYKEKYTELQKDHESLKGMSLFGFLRNRKKVFNYVYFSQY